ncbi:MAG: glycosyltransferase [Bacteroidota bacterium]
MRNLLIIAYYFPPSGGPGVQRVLKHVQYLPEFGWQPIVLTVSNGQFPARDESLLDHIPASTIVKRVPIYEPYDLYRFLTGKKAGTPIDVNVMKKESQKLTFKEKISEFIRATFFIPDARVGWLLTAKKGIKEIEKEYRIDAIYSSSPPYTCSLIARNLKRREPRLPWVAGFRDPWRNFLSAAKRWFLPDLFDIRMERSVFTEADAVECAWEGIIKDAMGKYPLLKREKFHHVPNGFDSSDFPVIEQKRNEKFTVTYTGSLYGRRNPLSFFTAIEKLISQNKIDPNELIIKFIGRFGAEVHEMIENTSFRKSIESIPYMPHEESIKQLFLSDVLLLIVDEAKESEEIVPGKVYEYIGVKKPVIAIAPEESAIADLIKETKSGMIAHQTNIEKTCEIIEKYYSDWKTGNSTFAPDTEAINKYERREAAKQLAALLDKLVLSKR